MRIVFLCKKCTVANQVTRPCEFSIYEGDINDRDDLVQALRRCPFESFKKGKYTGKSPIAEWKRVN